MKTIKSFNINPWYNNNISYTVVQGEGGIKYPRLFLTDSKGAINITSASVRYKCQKNDNSPPVYVDANKINETTGEVEFEITTDMTSCVGNAHGEIEVTTTDGVLKFSGINLSVIKGVSDSAIESSKDFSALQNALRKLESVTPEGTVLVDITPTKDSLSPVSSHGTYEALAEKLDSVVIENFTADETGLNLFNPQNIINGYIGNNILNCPIGGNYGTGFIKCKPKTSYHFLRNCTTSQFVIASSSEYPAANIGLSNTKYTFQETYTTPENAKYLLFYFYVGNKDIEKSVEEYAKNIMVSIEAVPEFEEYHNYGLGVDWDKLPNKLIGTERLSDEVSDEIKKITDKADNSDKICQRNEITNKDKNYPSIKYLENFYYDYLEIEDMFGEVSSAFDLLPGTNIFNPANVIEANINTSDRRIVSSPTSRTGYVKCLPNTTYTVIRNQLTSRFIIGTTQVFPAPDSSVEVIKSNNTLSSLTFTTGDNANFIVFYFYIGKDDGEYSQSFPKNIMIAEGEVNEFEFYQEKQILNEENLPRSVDERFQGIENEINGIKPPNTRFSTKSKIYGVTFNNGDADTKCERIENSIGLQTDYIVADKFQNGGRNDFDDVFPWCDVRRCNLSINSDGTKSITYENEERFSLDGSNGNVMVEIPKFYSFRELIGGKETWAVTGEPKSGFSIEPAFIDENGNELDYIYVAAYQFGGNEEMEVYSKSGAPVKTALRLEKYRADASSINMSCMDYATLHVLQQLFVIEFADRNTDSYMQGFSYLPWFSSSNAPIISVSSNRSSVTLRSKNTDRTSSFRAGQTVLICKHTENKQEKIQGELKITNITVNEHEVNKETVRDIEIEFDKAVSESVILEPESSFYVSGQAQETGTCDGISYHTGRVSEENNLSTFRYRWIENIWGNAWEILEGIRVKELKYYYTFNPARYADETVDNWQECSYAAPEQKYLGDDGKNRAWIKTMGYDINARQIILPLTCTAIDTNGNKTETLTDKQYYSSALYTQYLKDRNGNDITSPDKEYLCTFGGGWDHNTLCGLFTMRFWFPKGGEAATLHTTRLVARK